jgi:Zn-dependent protease
MDTLADKVAYLPVLLPVLIASLVLHELAHAVVATALGDKTPRREGRLTLNPVKHIEPSGAIFFLLTYFLLPFAFGWAKPVMVDRRNLNHPKRDMALVAIAGPLTNILIATVVAFLLYSPKVDFQYSNYVFTALNYTFVVNIFLAVFNMLPIPPLDGSRVVAAFMSGKMYDDWIKLDEYAPMIFLVVFFVLWGALQSLLNDLSGHVIHFLITLVT